jgi:protein TonB
MKKYLFIVSCVLAATVAHGKSDDFDKAMNSFAAMFKRYGTAVKSPAVFTVKYLQAQDCTEIPALLKNTPPAYPEKLKEQKVEGAALIELLVGTDGVPFQVQATRATHKDFADAAVASVSSWRFKPGTRKGKPVVVYLKVPLVFSL